MTDLLMKATLKTLTTSVDGVILLSNNSRNNSGNSLWRSRLSN